MKNGFEALISGFNTIKSVNLRITLIEIAVNKIQRVKRENEKEKSKEEKL